jgi:cyclopropane-fatty-acyl-phospholipid synthase
MNARDHALTLPALRRAERVPRATLLALDMLDRIGGGALGVDLPGGLHLHLGHGKPAAHLQVHDHAVFAETLARGDIGFAEAYMDGLWDSDDPSALLTLLANNREVLDAAIRGRVLRLLCHRLAHLLNANTRRRARRNIEAHYDLGNDFYALWLDPTMTYSAALFAGDDEADTADAAGVLAAAQLRKYRRILERLAPQPGQTVLEIGCGWGGFAEVAATEFGCRVLGLTLSPAQLAFARERAVRGAYADRARFELCDYRDVRGQYDHIVSIEMLEAVGERYWPVYFARIAELLKPGGRCAVQTITIADALFARYRRGTDFIQRHIFPGGMLPSPAALRRGAGRAGLAIADDFAFGRDYGRTLAHWQRAFMARAGEVRELGFPERFMRMWRFYLAYCEAGFVSGDIDVHQYVFELAAARAG